MVRALAQHHAGAFAGRNDVFAQVGQVDRTPDIAGEGDRLFAVQVLVAVEEGLLVAEGGLLEQQEAFEEPRLDIVLDRKSVV